MVSNKIVKESDARNGEQNIKETNERCPLCRKRWTSDSDTDFDAALVDPRFSTETGVYIY